jgi:hypothetical protein
MWIAFSVWGMITQPWDCQLGSGTASGILDADSPFMPLLEARCDPDVADQTLQPLLYISTRQFLLLNAVDIEPQTSQVRGWELAAVPRVHEAP